MFDCRSPWAAYLYQDHVFGVFCCSNRAISNQAGLATWLSKAGTTTRHVLVFAVRATRLGLFPASTQCFLEVRDAMLSLATEALLHKPAAALGQDLVDALRGVAGGASLAGAGHLPVSAERIGECTRIGVD